MKVIACRPLRRLRTRRPPSASRLAGFDEVIGTADFISIHSPRTEQTKGLFNTKTFAEDEEGRVPRELRARRDRRGKGPHRGAGQRHGARAPGSTSTTRSRRRSGALAKHPKVIATPHIGASTGEAQVNVSVMIARQIGAYLTRGEIINAVNGTK